MHYFIKSSLTLFLLCLSSAFTVPEPRDFNQLSEENKKDVNYILHILGTKSLISIGLLKNKICKVGARVHAIHPIRYLLHMLSEKELLCNLCAMQRSRLIWDGYLHGDHGVDGVLDAMQQEFDAGGITKAQIHELADRIGTKRNYMEQVIDMCDWERVMQLVMHCAMAESKYNPDNDI